MWRGHTYFVMIFALGLHECTRVALRSSSAWKRVLAEAVVTSAAFLQQGIEIYFVLKSRFHYTADVVMAIFITYLVYTNSCVAVMAKRWVQPTKDEQRALLNQIDKSRRNENGTMDNSTYTNAWYYNGLAGAGYI